MLNFLSTFGADSQFQKNRILLTKPTYEAPNQQALRNILRSFAGQDEQIRAQIAFATIIKKMQQSNDKQNWIQMLKNLIILDSVMSDNRFCQELAQTTLISVNNFTDRDTRSEAVNAKYLLKSFWQLIQELSRVKISPQHMLHYKRSQRKDYLDTLNTQNIFKQIKLLQKLFDKSLSLMLLTSGISNNHQRLQSQTHVINQKLIKYYQEFTNSPLAQYLSIHIYSKLLTFFSCQYLCIHKFIQVILHTTQIGKHALVSVEDAKSFKKMVLKFKNNCLEMKSLVDRNNLKKGFENIDTKEFITFNQQHIIKAIDQYISQHSTHQKLSIMVDLQTFINPSSKYIKHPQSKFVDKKPLVFKHGTGKSKNPKILIQQKIFIQQKKDPQEQKTFFNYFNSYSQQFPHKNMMTIDLIQDIRKDEQKMYQQILNSIEKSPQQHNSIQKNQSKQNQPNFFMQFKRIKTKLKFNDILVFAKDEKDDKQQESTSYSFSNSSRGGYLFDLLNIKWIPQKGQV